MDLTQVGRVITSIRSPGVKNTYVAFIGLVGSTVMSFVLMRVNQLVLKMLLKLT